MNINNVPEQDVKLLGKRVKLKEVYKTDDGEYQYGIIVEIVSHEYDRAMRQRKPRNVSLHLFNQSGQLYLCGDRDGIPIPTYVDFHVDEILLCTDNMNNP
jgi:hypothetical protein